jgi:ABC-type phosphate transport system auxiliary subunit
LSSLPQVYYAHEDGGNALSRATQLEKQIDTAFEDLRQNYAKTLRSVASLKRKVNDLELRASRGGSTQADELEKLNLAAKELDRFIDSFISQATRTKERCEKLKLKCSAQSVEPLGLKYLLSLCSEYEQLAKDLLCYSLGRLKK